ncbi:MAG: toprim domain-containing protein [Dehalococcoidia bacterium]|nr:toprim domain-containing protein [Dehalococcoidia bacterium]
MTVDVERVKRAHPIADVIAAHGVRLRASGRRFFARCPFHEDDRPSFVVYPDTQSFHCFGCAADGDVIDFVRRVRQVGFREALDVLGEREPRGAAPRAEARVPRALALDDRLILTAACELYHEALLRTPHALRYLEERGVPEWLVTEARLGYSDGTLLQPYLQRRRLSVRRAAAMGLLYPDRRRDGEWREAMRGRVVIPDLRAGYCAWMTGRVPADDTSLPYLDLALPKPLLGYEVARDHDRLLVTEGPFDWLTLRSWGFPACALLGTHPGAQPLRLLEHAPGVVLVLDGDDAGCEAAQALADRLPSDVSMVLLPSDVKDVNQLGRQPGGRETFMALLSAAEGDGDGVTAR